MFRPRGNVSIDNEQERFTIICGVVVVGVGVGPGNKRNLLLRAYQPLCGEIEGRGEGCWGGNWCCNCEKQLLLLPIRLLLG